MWRNRLSYGEISPHEKYGAKSVVWRKFLHMINVDSNLSCGAAQPTFLPLSLIQPLLIYQINNVYNLWCFNAYCAVLSQNLFCRDLRAFAWRKIEQKIVPVDKKGQISCMGLLYKFNLLGICW